MADSVTELSWSELTSPSTALSGWGSDVWGDHPYGAPSSGSGSTPLDWVVIS